MLYSKTTGGFYDAGIHSNIPTDAVPVTVAKHAELMAAQADGKRIVADSSGKPIAVDPPEPSTDEILAAITAQLQAALDAKAQQYGYDSIASAVSYAEEPSVPKFQREGRASRVWRSLFWAAAYEYLEDHSGPVPTVEQVLDELPEFVPPQ